MEEIWKPIERYEGLYCVSNFGRVKSLFRYGTKGRIRKLSKDRRSYLFVSLWKNSKRKWFLVHRLVGFAFIPNPNNLPQINHIDGNKLNNHVENLEWSNPSLNTKHAYKIGLHKGPNTNGNFQGEKHPHSKLSETQIREIRAINGLSSKEIAKKYNATYQNINNIITKRTWKHVI